MLTLLTALTLLTLGNNAPMGDGITAPAGCIDARIHGHPLGVGAVMLWCRGAGEIGIRGEGRG